MANASDEPNLTTIVEARQFSQDAAFFAAQAPAILTAQTAYSFPDYSYFTYTEEIDRSRSFYPINYGRMGVLGALEAKGVIHIPTSDRQIVNEVFRGEHKDVGNMIIAFFRDMVGMRKSNKKHKSA